MFTKILHNSQLLLSLHFSLDCAFFLFIASLSAVKLVQTQVHLMLLHLTFTRNIAVVQTVSQIVQFDPALFRRFSRKQLSGTTYYSTTVRTAPSSQRHRKKTNEVRHVDAIKSCYPRCWTVSKRYLAAQPVRMRSIHRNP